MATLSWLGDAGSWHGIVAPVLPSLQRTPPQPWTRRAPSLEHRGDRRFTRPLFAFRQVTTIAQGGILAAHNLRCVARWQPWL